MNRLLLAAALALGLFAALPARASVGERLELPELVAGSERVIRGRVTARTSAWDPSGMRIFTKVDVVVEDTLAGEPATGVTVFQWGGTVGEIGQLVVGEAPLQEGDHVVLFLERARGTPLADGWRCVGLAQGSWRVNRHAGGELRVFRKPSSLRLAIPGGRGSPVMVPDSGAPSRSYAELREQVQVLWRRKR